VEEDYTPMVSRERERERERRDGERRSRSNSSSRRRTPYLFQGHGPNDLTSFL
jgi:hypothetical protein